MLLGEAVGAVESRQVAIGVVSCTYSMNHLVYMFAPLHGRYHSADPAIELKFATDRQQQEYQFCSQH
jgi:hypothetical protein